VIVNVRFYPLSILKIILFRLRDEKIVEFTEHKHFHEDISPFATICINIWIS